MYCQKCGQQNEDSTTFCVKCGAQLMSGGSAAGPTPPATPLSSVYAGFWKRLAAFILDYIIVVLLVMLTSAMIGFIYGAVSDDTSNAEILGGIASLAVWWLYHAFMESSRKQATPGKMALGIKVTDQYGARLSFGRATGRHFAKFLSGMILAIGYLMAGFTAKKQALHDMIAGCLVVNRNATPVQVQADVPVAGMAWWAIVLIVMTAMVVPLGLVAAIAIPAYQDYTVRAKVHGAMQVGNQATAAVSDFYEKNKTLPSDLKAAGMAEPVSPFVKSVTVDPRTGAIRIVLAISTLEGKSILLVPQMGDQTIRWTCRSDDVNARYLPASCRGG